MSPAVSAWAEIWLHGRVHGIEAIVTASRPDRAFWADVAGTRAIGAGAPRSTWEAVAPEVEPPQDDPPHPGRIHAVGPDGSTSEVQTVWITPDEARALATE
jgi:hypothetical protein